MEHHDQTFTPEQVDEQVEKHLHGALMPNNRFSSEMRQVTRQLSSEQEHSLQRVEQRLLAHARSARRPTSTPFLISQEQSAPTQSTFIQGRALRMEAKQASKLARRITTLVALFVVVILIGSLLFVLNLSRQTVIGSKVIPTATLEKSYSSANLLCQFTTDNRDQRLPMSPSLDWSTNGRLAVAFYTLGIFDGTTCATQQHMGIQSNNALWSPDHTRILNESSTNFPQILDASTGKVLATYVPTAHTQDCCGGNGELVPFAFAWSADGTQIISLIGSQNLQWNVEIWSASTGKVISTPLTQNGTPSFIQLSPSGKHVVVGDKSGITIWSIYEETPVGHLPISVDIQHEPSAWAWSPEETFIALGTSDNKRVNIYDVSSGKVTASFTDHNVSSLAWSPDGKYLAESSSKIHLWDVRARKIVATFGEVSNKNWISNLAWSRDSTKLASSISTPPDWSKNTIKIWKLA